MWHPTAGFQESGSARALQQGVDAKILWYHPQEGRGVVWSSSGGARAFSRHELPADIPDHELPSIAMRWVHLGSFRFSQRGTRPQGDGVQMGPSGSRRQQTQGCLPPGGYTRVPAPPSGSHWQTPSSEERSSGSPGLQAGGSGKAWRSRGASGSHAGGESLPSEPRALSLDRAAAMVVPPGASVDDLRALVAAAESRDGREMLASWTYWALDAVRPRIPDSAGPFGLLAQQAAELEGDFLIQFAMDPAAHLERLLRDVASSRPLFPPSAPPAGRGRGRSSSSARAGVTSGSFGSLDSPGGPGLGGGLGLRRGYADLWLAPNGISTKKEARPPSP